MPRRRGITNNPALKRSQLEREYDGFRYFKVEKRFPNQEEAQKWENRQFYIHQGGPKMRGPFFGYSYYYEKKK